MKKSKLLRIGRIRKPHGVRGKMAVYLFNEHSCTLKINLKIKAGTDEESALASRTLTLSRIQKKTPENLILSFNEISSADDALKLNNACLFVDRDDLDISEDEIIIADLVGMDVYENDTRVGKVERIYCTGSGDVLVISTGDGVVDFPLHDKYLEFIDSKNNIMRVVHFSDFLEFKYQDNKKK